MCSCSNIFLYLNQNLFSFVLYEFVSILTRSKISNFVWRKEYEGREREEGRKNVNRFLRATLRSIKKKKKNLVLLSFFDSNPRVLVGFSWRYFLASLFPVFMLFLTWLCFYFSNRTILKVGNPVTISCITLVFFILSHKFLGDDQLDSECKWSGR